MTDEKKQIIFSVFGKPVAWQRTGGSGNRRYTKQKTRDYENLIKVRAAEFMAGSPPIDAPLAVTVCAFVTIPKSFSSKKRALAMAGIDRPVTRPDVDNYLKAALDGMNQIVYRDDSVVVSATVAKFYSEQPRLDIKVEVMR